MPLMSAWRHLAVFLFPATTCVVLPTTYGNTVLMSRSSNRLRIGMRGSFPPFVDLEGKVKESITGCHLILIWMVSICVVWSLSVDGYLKESRSSFPMRKICSSPFRIFLLPLISSPSTFVPWFVFSSSMIKSDRVFKSDCEMFCLARFLVYHGRVLAPSPGFTADTAIVRCLRETDLWVMLKPP